jgi:hypothetical protein
MGLHERLGVGLLVASVVLGPAAVEAADAGAVEARNEVVVFGGASVLDASRGYEAADVLPGWGGPWPAIPEIQVRVERSLGGSALFGARYSRYVKGRLAVEADFAIGPMHELQTAGQLCIEGRCYGPGTGGRGDDRGPMPVDLPVERFSERNLTAWHYGGGLAYDVTGGDVRPFVIFGAGGVSYSGFERASTDFVLRFGAGLKILFGRVGARVDVVDHLVTEHFLTGDAEHDIHATAGFLVRF